LRSFDLLTNVITSHLIGPGKGGLLPWDGVRGVNWFRRQTARICALALLALTIQLIASFGHFHYEDLFASGQRVAVAGAGNPASDGDAGQHEHSGLCGVCWAVQVLGNAQIAGPPLLPVAIVFTRTAICVPRPKPVALPDCQAFQSRAPPSA
jgi:hypothetical protein